MKVQIENSARNWKNRNSQMNFIGLQLSMWRATNWRTGFSGRV